MGWYRRYVQLAGDGRRRHAFGSAGGWLRQTMDYGDVVFHVFQEEARKFYALERLWGDAPNETLSF